MWIAIVAALALSQGTDVQRDEEVARERLARAEELVAKGQYAEAHERYERLAERFPETEAGRTAAERSKPCGLLGWDYLARNGEPSNRVDLVFLGDGYDLDDLGAYADRVEDAASTLATHEPWREYGSYLNVVRGLAVSEDSGIDGYGREYATALGGHVLSNGDAAVDGGDVRRLLALGPENDGLALVYVRAGKMGSYEDGIAAIGDVESGATGTPISTGAFVNRMLGHAFGRLGYEGHVSTWLEPLPLVEAPNVSVTGDPDEVPWAHWIAAKHNQVDVCEGAEGRVKGAWRPTPTGCVQGGWKEDYCVVCREALVLRIYTLVDPIDGCSPPVQPPGVYEPLCVGDEPLELRVRVLQPASHELEVRWWVLPAEIPRASGVPAASPGTTVAATTMPASTPDRSSRGPLPAIDAEPFRQTRAHRDGEHVLALKPDELPQGVYRVVCRVRDTTEHPRSRYPWVLRDARGLLESERVWWVRVRGEE
jgi:hypothetical protein